MPHYYGKGDIEQIEVHFVHDRDHKLWYESLKDIVSGRHSRNDSSSDDDDGKFSPRGGDDETPRRARQRSTSMRKKDKSTSTPGSPTTQQSIRSQPPGSHAPKKRHSTSHADRSAISHSAATHPSSTKNTNNSNFSLHNSLPDILPSHHHVPVISTSMSPLSISNYLSSCSEQVNGYGYARIADTNPNTAKHDAQP